MKINFHASFFEGKSFELNSCFVYFDNCILQNHKVYESCIFLINFLLFENNLQVGSCIKNNHNYEKKSSSL